MGITNPVETAALARDNSIYATAPLTESICNQEVTFDASIKREQQRRCKEIKQRMMNLHKTNVDELLSHENCSPQLRRCIENSVQKGASLWLSALPIDKEGFALHKSDFRDALLMRYSLQLPSLPIKCICGSYFDIDHAMVFKRGGFVSRRHNDIRDNLCSMLDDVCHDVTKEPPLQPLTGETFELRSTNISETARLDIRARGF